MERDGILSPATPAEAQSAYEDLLPTARTVVREVAKAMAFDREEFDERVTAEVVATAHDALFASLLEVEVGTRQGLDGWRQDSDFEVVVVGSEHAPNAVWHAPPFSDVAVAATFDEDREAALATLRRQAFGRIYRDALESPDG